MKTNISQKLEACKLLLDETPDSSDLAKIAEALDLTIALMIKEVSPDVIKNSFGRSVQKRAVLTLAGCSIKEV